MTKAGKNNEKRKMPAAGDKTGKLAGGVDANKKIEERDYSFEACRKLEFHENAFSPFYTHPRKVKTTVKEDAENLHGANFELNVYRHDDAIDFAAKSWEWRNDSNKNQLILPRSTDRKLLPTNCCFTFHDSIRAYYRVIAELEDKYILMACHTNLHGFHRGDLCFVEVTDRTITKQYEFSVIGKLFLGDIVSVTRLSKINKTPLNPPPKALKMTQESKLVWEVAEMRVLVRKFKENVVFAFMKTGLAIVKGFNEAMKVVFNETDSINFNSLYTGDAFVPVKLRCKFIGGCDTREQRIELMKRSSEFVSCPSALGTIHKYQSSKKLTKQFKIGVDAFKIDHKFDPEDVTELCAQMGQSAVLTIFNGRSDSRLFLMQNCDKSDNVIRFSIPNPLKYPTEGLWNCNNRIKIQGFEREFDGTIETVLPNEKDRLLQICARVSEESMREMDFRHGRTYVVHQREPRRAMFLKDGFLKDEHSSKNGSRIIRTLYGGPSLRKEVLDCSQDSTPKYVFPSVPPVSLNEYQNQYVQMITSKKYPMVLGSSPFGCGKSMTIVMAAITALKKSKGSQQILVSQSNYAGVNLIDIARKVKDTDLKILRYVSERNWKELPDQCKTEFDKPVWMETTLKRLAYGEIPHGKDFPMRNVDLVMAYFYNNPRKFHIDLLCDLFRNRYLKNIDEIRDIPIKIRERELFVICMKYNEPNVIVVTADTLQSVARHSKEFVNVTTIQIDEACQLPECTLISLLVQFPNANYGLIGDIKQLPPYCEDDLKGKLKEYGIGNTMERAIQQGMFPEAVLRYVYRCHPKTTDLLSELFYDGKLISGVQEEQRNEFMRKRPDIWPNSEYPLICVDNKDKGYKVGTSCANKTEKLLVKQIVRSLMEKKNGYKLQESDIGVISFYAAQTAILVDSFRGTQVKCGTVDAFQGSEREVIVLCCTNEKISEFMQLSNRLNVAMSRARQATIVIGNLKGLSAAKYWRTILESAEKNGCVVDTSKPPFRVVVEKDNNGKGRQDESNPDPEADSEMGPGAGGDKENQMNKRRRRNRGGRGRKDKRAENPGPSSQEPSETKVNRPETAPAGDKNPKNDQNPQRKRRRGGRKKAGKNAVEKPAELAAPTNEKKRNRGGMLSDWISFPDLNDKMKNLNVTQKK
ncbi:hypothetical protein CAEBREN_02375 [Caenorhabditis brenneri]|uniref:DNA2/NAM7 helicase-like C-terminal domain-containing protein n=1 Tax=Caenorhabditis brenneri TaxID=135651 RepID=G0P9X7_CAEBE|nr:hypothetical protein CAEBREN_02375 [Caenorhabditis brenneri]